MIRILNLTLVLITGTISLGVYRVAEQARMTALDLRETRAAIARENQSMTVLGAEWARLTQPARIQALAERYLKLDDRPAAQVASIKRLPGRFAPQPESAIRNASAIIPQAGQQTRFPAVSSGAGDPVRAAPQILRAGT